MHGWWRFCTLPCLSKQIAFYIRILLQILHQLFGKGLNLYPATKLVVYARHLLFQSLILELLLELFQNLFCSWSQLHFSPRLFYARTVSLHSQYGSLKIGLICLHIHSLRLPSMSSVSTISPSLAGPHCFSGECPIVCVRGAIPPFGLDGLPQFELDDVYFIIGS